MSPDELEPVYFVVDPRDEFQQESIHQFIQSASLPFSADQLVTILGHIQRIFNELANSEDAQPDFPAFSTAQIKAVADSFEEVSQRLLTWQKDTAPDLLELDTYLGRGKRRMEYVLDGLCDSTRSKVDRAQLAVDLAEVLNQPIAQCAQGLLDLANRAKFQGHPLPGLLDRARRSLVENALCVFLDKSFEQDQSLEPANRPALLEHLQHALSLEFNLPHAHIPRFSKALEPLVEQAAEFVRKALQHSAVLVHFIQHFSKELEQACCSPQWSDGYMLKLVRDSSNRIHGFCPLQFEHLLKLLNQLGYDSNEFHHPVLAECKASATGLGKQQILYAGKVMWVCIQSHSTSEKTDRYHRPFLADDLAWFLQTEASFDLKIELLGEHLTHLPSLSQDEAPYLHILKQASRPRCTLRKWWGHLSGKPINPVINWNKHLACFALEQGYLDLYRYFSSALSESVMGRMIHRCIEKGEALMAVLRLGDFDEQRVRALVSASFHAVWMAQAAEKNRVRMIYFLAQHGADLNVRNVIGRTPLVWATKLASKEAVKALLDCGANPLLSYKNGRDLCHYASLCPLDAEAKFSMVKRALLAAAIRPECVEPALAWGHEVRTKRSWLKDLDPKPCTGYVWAWVSMGMLEHGVEEIQLLGRNYTAELALAQALEHDPECVPALLAKAACAAIESSDPRGEIIAAYADAFRVRWAEEGKENSSGPKPYLADLWAGLAAMPLWDSTPQLSTEESSVLTSAAKTSHGRVTPLDCVINAIELAPNNLFYQDELQQKIPAYRDHDWLSQTDAEFAKTIAQDAEDKSQFLCRALKHRD